MKKSRKYEAICSLSEALKNQPENEGDLTDIISALEKEPDRKKRKRIMKDFICRFRETADFFAENEDVINARAEAALIGAAVGGNVNALKFYLKNRMPDKYSDKPKENIEIEDISETEGMLYGGEDGGKKDDTV